MLVPLKIACTLLWQKILLHASLKPGTQGTEIRMFLITDQFLDFWFFDDLIGLVIFEKYLMSRISGVEHIF